MALRFFANRVVSILILFLLFLSLNGCFNSCGLFGSTSTSSVLLSIKQPIEQTSIQKGRQETIQLNEYLAGNRKCTGNPDCDCKDGLFPATKFSYSIEDSSIADVKLTGVSEYTISEFRDREIFRGDSAKLEIRAKLGGKTTINVKSYFVAEGTTDYSNVVHSVNFPVFVTDLTK